MLKKIILIFVIFFASSMVIHADDKSAQQFQGFNLSGYDSEGNKTWDIEGDRADILGNIVKLSNIVANAYGEDDMHLVAQRGTMDKVSGNIHLEEDVVITTQSGTKLVTDSLDWDRNNDLAQTDDDVTIMRENMVAFGKGAEAHPNKKSATMKKDVDVKIEMKPEGNDKAGRIITITCDGPLEVDYAKQYAVFNDNVVAIDGDRKLTADKAELYFDNTSNKIKEIICIGNVVIYQGENASHSERAIYKAEEQRVILTGRPKIIFYAEEEME